MNDRSDQSDHDLYACGSDIPLLPSGGASASTNLQKQIIISPTSHIDRDNSYYDNVAYDQENPGLPEMVRCDCYSTERRINEAYDQNNTNASVEMQSVPRRDYSLDTNATVVSGFTEMCVSDEIRSPTGSPLNITNILRSVTSTPKVPCPRMCLATQLALSPGGHSVHTIG